MNSYSSDAYNDAKKWIAEQKNNGFTWEDIEKLCTTEDNAEKVFYNYRDEELIFPGDMEYREWGPFVSDCRGYYSVVTDPYGLKDSEGTMLPLPIEYASPWAQYKRYLLGQKDGIQRMSDIAVSQMEKNAHWVLNHISRDTRQTGPKKGLVMGSVQSGKTANMIGLVTMAANYDWNFFIILSGSIDNLRKQTRDRFKNDLLASGGVKWHILEKTSKPEYLADLETGKKYLSDSLELNMFQTGKSQGNWMHRYVTVCLKNSTRLKNLITWLHANSAKAARMRILVIDDEADQAGINTKRMDINETDEELLERTMVNQLIINLVNGKNYDGSDSHTVFQAMNYVSFTATPYANILNEAYESSLYPKDFICSLPESKEYFGPKVSFGSESDESYPGLDIIRDIPESEIKYLKFLHSGNAFMLPTEMKNSLCWFLCAASVLRNKGYKKPISMLIHTTAIQNDHFEEYEAIKEWFNREKETGLIIENCRVVYEEEITRFTKENLKECYPDYSLTDQVDDDFPNFSELKNDIQKLISNVANIMMGEKKEEVYTEDAIHLCVDNCKANKVADEGTYLRIVYPSKEELQEMERAPVFIVMGGNTLSRGLTIEGLVCTYFGRNSNQADTLMQMARWFGYRKGYELLQRIWMPVSVQRKFEQLEKIDEKLKEEFEEYTRKGRSPLQFGPRITTTPAIARFLVTAKNKSQNAIECDFDFSGDSYETTKFEDDQYLVHNINITNEMLSALGTAELAETSESAYIWRNVEFSILLKNFFGAEKYHIYECSSLYADMPVFLDWMTEMNQEDKYIYWNVAVTGDKNAISRWNAGNVSVGKIERSRKSKPEYVDIGSLRSGLDALCDIKISDLDEKQKELYNSTVKNRTSILSVRGALGMEDVPLLLLYCIDKNRGKETKAGRKTKLNTKSDIIGFSIIIAGEPNGGTHARAVTVRIPD